MGIEPITCDFRVELEELLQGVVRGEALDTIVWNSVLGSTFRTLNLPFDVVHQTFHTRLHTIRMLAWQQFRVSVSVQTNTAREELVKLLHN